MTVSIALQRGFAPQIQQQVNITFQRMFAPFMLATGVSVTHQRMFVPFIEDAVAATRRRQMMFQP